MGTITMCVADSSSWLIEQDIVCSAVQCREGCTWRRDLHNSSYGALWPVDMNTHMPLVTRACCLRGWGRGDRFRPKLYSEYALRDTSADAALRKLAMEKHVE